MDYYTDFAEPPQPEENLANYTRERLQKGLKFVNDALKRNITPRTAAFLRLHKDALEKALILYEHPKKEPAQAVVQSFDELYNSGIYYFKSRSPEEYEHLQHYTRLRQMEVLIYYGDYLNQTLHTTNATAECEPPTTWQAIADQMARTGVKILELNNSVFASCCILGLDGWHMIPLIENWSNKWNNSLLNPPKAQNHISACNWSPFAIQICRDLKELCKIVTEQDEVERIEKVLVDLRDKYFTVLNPDDPTAWLPNELATELTQERAKKNIHDREMKAHEEREDPKDCKDCKDRKDRKDRKDHKTHEDRKAHKFHKTQKKLNRMAKTRLTISLLVPPPVPQNNTSSPQYRTDNDHDASKNPLSVSMSLHIH